MTSRHRCAAILATTLALVHPLPQALATEPGIVESKFELFVGDVEESIRFYEALGFEVAAPQS